MSNTETDKIKLGLLMTPSVRGYPVDDSMIIEGEADDEFNYRCLDMYEVLSRPEVENITIVYTSRREEVYELIEVDEDEYEEEERDSLDEIFDRIKNIVRTLRNEISNV